MLRKHDIIRPVYLSMDWCKTGYTTPVHCYWSNREEPLVQTSDIDGRSDVITLAARNKLSLSACRIGTSLYEIFWHYSPRVL